ncbi:membrane protein [Desulfosarcina ovata subsp. sediminis]|uniref:Membrane protein n=1 Tax=Desulfosarcina ovata subsp. sediminis TaxID=885957 RepID=A0A5K7ZIE2_9BACT|nr:DUF364 domain-containing protein [Desulfosarcina ovata]BBO81892.1 membrane protein [Desulfosarcina ovata subsp. sediminis]
MFNQLKSSFIEIAHESGLMETEVNITARQLTPREAIGETERKDFPLLQGKESLMQAEFKGAIGQAFTDIPMNFKGKIKDIVEIKLSNNGERALFISALNAVMRHLEKADKTIHCKNKEPEMCAKEMAKSVINKYGIKSNIGIIGFQPAIIDNFSKIVSPGKVKVTDLDKDNIGKKKYGISIWDGKTMEEEIFKTSDVLLATGSTIVNNSLEKLTIYAEKHNKPIYFYGTTIAGPAIILNLKRLCFNAS